MEKTARKIKSLELCSNNNFLILGMLLYSTKKYLLIKDPKKLNTWQEHLQPNSRTLPNTLISGNILAMSALRGKVAIITGASSGIGKATALEFSKQGVKVALADINDQAGNNLVNQIETNQGEAIFIKTDVSDLAQVKNLVTQTTGTFGRIDYAFNNAGIEGEQTSTAESNKETWKNVIDVNLKGVWACLKYEIPEMLKNENGGAIVNCSSVAGSIGFPNLAPYVASKHGVIGLTRTAALEYAEKNIRVNAVCPGVIKTPMVDRVTGGDPELEKQYAEMSPMNRMGKPEEIAKAVVWLCSDEASYITGETLTIDGGMTAG